MRRISSCSPICDTSDIHCVANESVQKGVNFLLVLHSGTMNYGCGCIENRNSGGESTHKSAPFMYRSICCAANGQLLGAKKVEIRTLQLRKVSIRKRVHIAKKGVYILFPIKC